MNSEEQLAKWVDSEGYAYPFQILRGAGCIAIGEDDVGLFIEYQVNAVDRTVHTVRVRMTAENALQLAAALREQVDRPRTPSPRPDTKPR
jgi:hypothetical protein